MSNKDGRQKKVKDMDEDEKRNLRIRLEQDCRIEQALRDPDLLRIQLAASKAKMKAISDAITESYTRECNEEYLFAPWQRDTLWDQCERIYHLGEALIDAENNAERVGNMRALQDCANQLAFECTDFLLDLGATVTDDNGECYDAIVLPTKTKEKP